MSEPIRVAQILNRMDKGGMEAVVMNYYRYMNRSQVQFDFCLAKDNSFPQREEMDVFCLPSFYEEMPAIAWEVQINGLPCVFSDEVSNFLSLNAKVYEWVRTCQAGKERKKSHIPKIWNYVKELQSYYNETERKDT